MDRHVRTSELLLGVEGLALLRHLYDGTDAAAARRVAEIRQILDDERLDAGAPIRETDARGGYREWSHTYDEPGNQIIALEQPEVWSLLEPLAPGRALDAACGTGRHAARLTALGHSVVGVDLTPEMLARARANVPAATFVQAICSRSRPPTGSSTLSCAAWPSRTCPIWTPPCASSPACCGPAATC